LLKKAPESEYYAFCDQDDIWDYNKLNIAISQIQKGSRKYEIYCCGHKLVDKDLNLLRIHRLDVRRSLTTRMILSYVSGNTLVMNNALKKKITQYCPKNIMMHDAWCFKVAICLGADVHIDPEPHILYRQHEDNVVGMEISIIDKIRKFNNLIKEKDIYKQLIEIKYAYANEILPEYEQVLQLIEGNKNSISKKTRLLLRRDINFYNIFLNLAFKLKVITNNFA
jgi:rhamnosyltransferase